MYLLIIILNCMVVLTVSTVHIALCKHSKLIAVISLYRVKNFRLTASIYLKLHTHRLVLSALLVYNVN